jgi:hypothetical protein
MSGTVPQCANLSALTLLGDNYANGCGDGVCTGTKLLDDFISPLELRTRTCGSKEVRNGGTSDGCSDAGITSLNSGNSRNWDLLLVEPV